MSFNIIAGDVLSTLQNQPSDNFDGCLCDPPYGLGFMGKEWDHGVPAKETWAEVLRVLKPGAHLLAFGGTRTHHRLMCAIEDAGFEIRDVIVWLYGSGFPKSLDISKALDKAAGAEREVVSSGAPLKRMIPGADQNATGSWIKDNGREFIPSVTTPATDAARLFDGYGTALKPAYEPIIVAMKPLDGTFAENALKHGVAGINVDGSRIDLDGDYKCKPNGRPSQTGLGSNYDPQKANKADTAGRWPANVLLNEEAAALLDQQTGELTSGALSPANNVKTSTGWSGGSQADRVHSVFTANSGGASRFFYCAKASASDRGEGNNHPTVKPLDLCRYLATLILPPAGAYPRQLLVPFSGSGSEMLGALMGGWDSITGVEREQNYIDIANRRLAEHCPLLVAL